MGGSRLLPDGQPLSKVKSYRYESGALMLIQDMTPILSLYLYGNRQRFFLF
jgi:hypothetical protein